jgi:hypothetical protein
MLGGVRIDRRTSAAPPSAGQRRSPLPSCRRLRPAPGDRGRASGYGTPRSGRSAPRKPPASPERRERCCCPWRRSRAQRATTQRLCARPRPLRPARSGRPVPGYGRRPRGDPHSGAGTPLRSRGTATFRIDAECDSPGGRRANERCAAGGGRSASPRQRQPRPAPARPLAFRSAPSSRRTQVRQLRRRRPRS